MMKGIEESEKWQVLVKKVGFGLAAVLLEEELPPHFWETLTFEQWKEVCSSALSGSDLKKTALGKMAKKATTFNEWKGIYSSAPLLWSEGSYLRETALGRMKELGTFEQWKEVYSSAPPESDLRKTALGKMKELVDSLFLTE